MTEEIVVTSNARTALARVVADQVSLIAFVCCEPDTASRPRRCLVRLLELSFSFSSENPALPIMSPFTAGDRRNRRVIGATYLFLK